MQYSILYYQDVKRNPDFRYEPEFFLPKYLEQEKKLLKIDTILLKECAAFSNGRAFDSQEFASDGDIHIAKIGDVTKKRDYQQWELISKDHFNSLNARYLVHNDILMTLTGDPPDVGKVQLIHEPSRNKLSWNQRVALLRLKQQENINSSEYLFAALSSNYCRDHIERWAKGIRQRNVGNPAVLNMAIPMLSGIQNHITDIIQSSFSLLKISNQIYAQAQTLLLPELGLTSWQPQHRLTFVKNYSHTEQAGRIDAEYYQPKYEEIDKVLIKLNGRPIGSYEFLDITTGQYCPNYVSSNEGRPYLRGTDLAVGSVATENLFYIKPEDQIQSKQAQEGDVVVTRVGTIGLSARIPEECDGGTISDNLIRVRILDESKIDSYYLSCFLGSEIGKSLMLRNARGSVQQRLNQETLKEIILPIPEMEVQSKIKDKIIESFNLRKQSKHLLECAKRAVEVAIEQDEQTAIDWLEKETAELHC